jgi:polar amino acid transport system substrate-binding protein
MTGRRSFLACAGVLAVLAAGGGDARAQAPAARPLVWAADAEGGEPYVFHDAANKGREIGFEVDLVEALSKELDRPIEFKQYDFKNLLLGLERGDFDFAMNGLEVTPDREEKVRFSRPYYVFKLQLAVRADEEEVKTLLDCRRLNAPVGTLANTAAERLLDRMRIDKKIYDIQSAAYLDLENLRSRAVLMDLPIALYYVKGNPRLKFTEKPVGGRGYYAIAFRKTDAALADEFDGALGRLEKKGELRRIYEKWGLWNDSQDELAPPNQFSEEGDEGSANQPRAGESWTFDHYFPLLWDGARLTVALTLASMLVAVALGLPIAVARLYGPAPLRGLAVAYVECFRGIPVLLLLFLLYFGLPPVSRGLGLGDALVLGPEAAAVLGLGMNYAAYEAEIYRAGISSIPAGQWEAAASLGMSPGLSFRRIILPQALRVILPPSTSDFVALFKDTSIASTIGLVELSKQYQILSTSGADYSQIALIGAVTATLYLLMALPLGHLSRYLEKRWGWGVVG